MEGGSEVIVKKTRETGRIIVRNKEREIWRGVGFYRYANVLSVEHRYTHYSSTACSSKVTSQKDRGKR